MKQTKKITHTFISIAFTLIVAIWALFMFWSFYPYQTVVINEQPYIVNDNTIKQGENVTYLIDACVYTEVVPTIIKQFVDGIIYAVPQSTIKLPMGCNKTFISVKIPKNLPPSEYHLHIYVEYKMNPIRTIVSSYETEKFNVIK